jgi:hypothetical protein
VETARNFVQGFSEQMNNTMTVFTPVKIDIAVLWVMTTRILVTSNSEIHTTSIFTTDVSGSYPT